MAAETGFRHTEATKRKLSDLRRGEKNPFFGRKHTDEFKVRQSARTKVLNANRQYEIEPRTVPDLADPQAAYLAGIVDGEGSITRRNGRRSASISVCNTSYALMRWLMQATGKKRVYTRKIQASAIVKARAEVYVFEIFGASNIAYLLKAMRPYLTIKADRADDVLAQLHELYGERL